MCGEPFDEIVSETVQVVPELFLGNILIRAAVDTNDANPGAKLLFRLRIVVADCGVTDSAGDQIDCPDLRVLGQCLSEVDDVFGLPARISVTAQFQPGAAYQPVYADQTNVEFTGGRRR